MAFISVNNSEIGTRLYRTNSTGSWDGTTTPAYASGTVGFPFTHVDYTLFIVSSSFHFRGTTFDAVSSDYDIEPVTISGSAMVKSFGSFVAGRTIYTSMSRNDDMNQMTSFFRAVSSDYIGLTASLDTRETIDLGTTSNIDADQPEFPDPPPVGTVDINRFRKTYTHVRVRPRVRKYSTSP